MRDLLPQQYIHALGKFSLPRDEGKSIDADMQNGALLTGSDRSIKDNVAICCYMILPQKSMKWIREHGYVAGTPHLLASSRAEHSATISVILVLSILSVRWNLTNTTSPGHNTRR